jgi:hypothetical protein
LRATEAGLEVRDKSELIKGSYDIVIDCAGTDSDSTVDTALVESFEYLSKNATILLLGAYFHTVPILPLSIVVHEYSIIGSFGYNSVDVAWLKTRIEEIDFDFSKVIDEISLKDIIEEGYYRGEVAKDSFTRIVVKC